MYTVSPKIERFEDIIAWQKAKGLTALVYQQFKDCRDFAFRDQIQRAAVSVMNNIAEGYERQGDKEFKRFLYIAKGSCGEVRSMLDLALELDYVSADDFTSSHKLCLEASKLLSGFIKTL
ncbi:MAG TPA: four helix bundle protein [Candidatus Saccharimonadales bacterium]|nr:four helix bundle protein [Candidatus Saccharimonadales bacterium]